MATEETFEKQKRPYKRIPKNTDFSLLNIIDLYCITSRGYINPMIDRFGERFFLKRIPKDVFEEFKHILLSKEKIIEIIYKHNIRNFANGIKTTNICNFCGSNNCNFIGLKKGFQKHCSQACSNKNEITKEKIKQTNIDNWGVYNVFSNSLIKEKIKQTNLSKYGVENASQNPEIKKKAQKTTFEKYGCYNVFSSPEIQEIIKQKNISKFGVPYPLTNEDIKKKSKKTFIEKGLWRSEDELDLFQIYKNKVWYYTEKNSKFIKDIEKRSKDFHLDHKFSISQGFKENIPPFIIGNYCNLRIIPALENVSKNYKCCISIDELINAFYLNKKENNGK